MCNINTKIIISLISKINKLKSNLNHSKLFHHNLQSSTNHPKKTSKLKQISDFLSEKDFNDCKGDKIKFLHAYSFHFRENFRGRLNKKEMLHGEKKFQKSW